MQNDKLPNAKHYATKTIERNKNLPQSKANSLLHILKLTFNIMLRKDYLFARNVFQR